MSSFLHRKSALNDKETHAAVRAALSATASNGVRTLLLIAESAPVIGPIAVLLNQLVAVCDQAKCNKEAFKHLKTRLEKFSILYSDVLKSVGENSFQLPSVQKCLTDLQVKMFEAHKELYQYAKAGFISHFLTGSKPQQTFDSLDSCLTQYLNELSAALQVHVIVEQAKTYSVVCNIKSNIDAQLGGFNGISMSQEKLEQVVIY